MTIADYDRALGERARRLTPDPDHRLRATSRHEAAHAVVGRALGVRIISATVYREPVAGALGETEFDFGNASLVTRAAVYMAGDLEERLFADVVDVRRVPSCGDAAWLARNTDDFVRRQAHPLAVEALRGNRIAVLQLADDLFRRRHVNFDQSGGGRSRRRLAAVAFGPDGDDGPATTRHPGW